MLVRLHVVIDTEEEAMETEVKAQLLELCPTLSFSPSRPQPSLSNCQEFYATAHLDQEQAQTLRLSLNNDWDGEEDDCDAYGFNTCMFHSHVYYIQFQIQ